MDGWTTYIHVRVEDSTVQLRKQLLCDEYFYVSMSMNASLYEYNCSSKLKDNCDRIILVTYIENNGEVNEYLTQCQGDTTQGTSTI